MLLDNHTVNTNAGKAEKPCATEELFVYLSVDLLCVITVLLVSLPYKEGTFTYCFQIFGNHSIVLTDKKIK